MIEVIEPRDEAHWKELRSRDLTSTEISTLFGISPYCTLFELWHRKKNKTIVSLEENERMLWGTRLQDAIAEGIALDENLSIRKMTEYIRDPDARLGSSFDFAIADDGLLEIKNVDWLQHKLTWIIERDIIEAPLHIEMQVQHQLLITGRKYAIIGALVGGNQVRKIRREPDKRVHAGILKEAKKFWDSIDNNTPPVPNFEKDAEFISKLYGYADPGKVKDFEGDNAMLELAQRYKKHGEEIKRMETKREAIKAQLIMSMGDAEKAIAPDYTISAGVVGPATVSYERKAYRSFRVNFKKEKA